MLSKVYINLIDQKEPTLNLKENSQQLQKTDHESFSYYKEIIKPTDVELNKHQEYLKQNLKKNFFN